MNSAVMELVAGPRDLTADPSVRRILQPPDETRGSRLSHTVLDQGALDRLFHHSGHRLVSNGGTYPQLTDQLLGKVNSEIPARVHVFKLITCLCDRTPYEWRARISSTLGFERLRPRTQDRKSTRLNS